MAEYFAHRCQFPNCGRSFYSQHDLIIHIEATHINFNPAVIEESEQAVTSVFDCVPMSYVLKYTRDTEELEDWDEYREDVGEAHADKSESDKSIEISPDDSHILKIPTGGKLEYSQDDKDKDGTGNPDMELSDIDSDLANAVANIVIENCQSFIKIPDDLIGYNPRAAAKRENPFNLEDGMECMIGNLTVNDEGEQTLVQSECVNSTAAPDSNMDIEPFTTSRLQFDEPGEEYILVIDGESLNYTIEPDDMEGGQIIKWGEPIQFGEPGKEYIVMIEDESPTSTPVPDDMAVEQSSEQEEYIVMVEDESPTSTAVSDDMAVEQSSEQEEYIVMVEDESPTSTAVSDDMAVEQSSEQEEYIVLIEAESPTSTTVADDMTVGQSSEEEDYIEMIEAESSTSTAVPDGMTVDQSSEEEEYIVMIEAESPTSTVVPDDKTVDQSTEEEECTLVIEPETPMSTAVPDDTVIEQLRPWRRMKYGEHCREATMVETVSSNVEDSIDFILKHSKMRREQAQLSEPKYHKEKGKILQPLENKPKSAGLSKLSGGASPINLIGKKKEAGSMYPETSPGIKDENVAPEKHSVSRPDPNNTSQL